MTTACHAGDFSKSKSDASLGRAIEPFFEQIRTNRNRGHDIYVAIMGMIDKDRSDRLFCSSGKAA
jgi:hypothetical protein